MTHTTGAYLRIDPPTEHVVVQFAQNNPDPVVRVFGPFPTAQAATDAMTLLADLGFDETCTLAIKPLLVVEQNERPADHEEPTEGACGYRWATPGGMHGVGVDHSCGLGQLHDDDTPGRPHRCNCGVVYP